MNEDLSSKKRPAEEGGDEASSPRPLKRAHINAADDQIIENFIPTPARKFLLLHLQILRAVYDDNADDSTEDGTVDKENWKIIQNFLKERAGIQSMFHQVQSCQGVHDEAVDFIQEQREERMMMITSSGDWAAARVGAVPSLLRSSLLFKTTQPSPHVPRFSASSSLLSAAENDEDESNQGEAFGLIAALLHQKYDVADDLLTEKTNPYRKLLQDVRRRVGILGELRRKVVESSSSQTAGENNNNDSEETRTTSPEKRLRLEEVLSRRSHDSNEESLARLDTKLRLWNLLLNDLARST
jgi:hypothetical protein